MANMTMLNFTNDNWTEYNPDFLEKYQKERDDATLLSTIIYSIVTISGIVGNAFVLLIYTMQTWNNQMDSRYFIPKLAFYDLIVCLNYGVFGVISNYVKAILLYSENLCKFLYFITFISTMTSNAFLLAISVQRFLMICRPLGRQMNLLRRRIVAGLVIMINLVLSVPVLLVSGHSVGVRVYKESLKTKTTRCSLSNHQYPSFQIIYHSFVILVWISYLITTIGMYTPIMCVLYRHFKERMNKTDELDVSVFKEDATAQKDRIHIAEEVVKNHKIIEQSPPTDIELKQTKESIESERNKEARVLPVRKVTKKAKTPVTNFNMMFFTIIFIYVMAYVPTIVMIILTTLGYFRDTVLKENYGILDLLFRFYVVNHAANPFVYAFFDLQMRKRIRQMFKGKLCCGRGFYNINWFYNLFAFI